MALEFLEDLLLESGALFNSYAFLFLILPLTLAGYWAIDRNQWKLGWLVLMSALFYSLYDARFLLLVYASAILDFFIARRIPDSKNKQLLLTASLCFNLGALFFFKYALFASENAVSLLNIAGADLAMPLANIVLPVGISFYTFQTISYTVDVYRGDVQPTNNLLKFVCFVSMFPQLVAGPIVRYKDLDSQLDAIPSKLSEATKTAGISLFVLGLAKKVIIADSIALMVEPAWSTDFTLLSAWVAMLGYTAQLYFDFSGYSDMALGLGLLLGLRLPLNFDAPYQARNPSDFWRRWHMTLGAFLRDYLYKPLGGAHSHRIRNLILVMVLGGLWHGAAWTFVIWGAYHGFWLVLYHLNQARWDKLPVALQRGSTFFIVAVGWVLFRAETMDQAWNLLSALVAAPLGILPDNWWQIVLALIAAGALTPNVRRNFVASKRMAVSVGLIFFICLIYIGRGEAPFLYYNF